MRRRELVTFAGATLVAWPLAARAQQGERMRRIGVLLPARADDPEYQARFTAFVSALNQLSWINGSNVQINPCWSTGDAEHIRKCAAELVAFEPDVILAVGGTVLGPLLQATKSLPVVFASVTDPVGAGHVASLARPGGNATGFANFEYATSGKWLQLLKEIEPRVKRAAVLRDTNTSGGGQFGSIQSAATLLGIEISPVGVREPGDIERALTAFARVPNGGLIVTSSARASAHRRLIVSLAASNHLPAVYANRYFVLSGGLMSYAPDRIDQYRKAAGYVDRILKGESPGNLPVQAPVKYELLINLKTAEALGLTVPQSLLARADGVIE